MFPGQVQEDVIEALAIAVSAQVGLDSRPAHSRGCADSDRGKGLRNGTYMAAIVVLCQRSGRKMMKMDSLAEG
jgi:hypothetical protein